MTFRERAPRTRLQIALEAYGSRFIGKLDDHVTTPQPARGRVRTTSGIMGRKSPVDIRRHSNVEGGIPVRVRQHIHEAPAFGHANSKAIDLPERHCGKCAEYLWESSESADSASL